MRTSNTFQEFWDKVQKVVPHAAYIQQEDAQRWWESLDADSFNDEQWHLRRLGRVGGSESAILVASHFGEPQPFGETPATLFDRKMMRVPLSSNMAMEFGHKHEDQARKLYEERLAAQGYVRDEEGMEKLRAYLDASSDQSMSYSPDDLFVKRDAEGNPVSRVLADYKAPYAGKIPGLRGAPEDLPFSYVAQLHHGADLLSRAGLRDCPLSLRLCYLDAQDNLAKPGKSSLVVYELEEDPELIEVIQKHCDGFVQDLRAGVRPLPLLQEGTSQEAVRETLSELVEKQRLLVELSAQQKSLDKEIKDIRKAMADLVAPLVPLGGKVSSEDFGLQVSTRVSYKAAKGKEDALLEAVQQTLVDDEETLQSILTKKVDLDRISVFLQEHGHTLEDFSSVSGIDFPAYLEADPEVFVVFQKEGLIQAELSFAVPAKLKLEDIQNPWESAKHVHSEVAEVVDGAAESESVEQGGFAELDEFDDIPELQQVQEMNN